jgi:hypothetical protein
LLTSWAIFRSVSPSTVTKFVLFLICTLSITTLITISRVRNYKLLILTSTLLILYFASYSPNWTQNLLPPIFYISAAYSCALFVHNIAKGRYEQCKFDGKSIVGLAISALIIVSSNHVAALGNYKLLYSNYLHVDVLFHSSIISIIKNYGIASTGVNGICTTIYHDLFHRMAAGISSITTISAFDILMFLQLTLILPAMLCSFSHYVAVQRQESTNLQNLLRPTLTLFTFCAVARPFGFFDFFMQSESQCLGITLLVLLGAYLHTKNDVQQFVLPTVSTCILAICLTKGPTGIWAFILVTCWAVTRIKSRRAIFLTICTSLVALTVGMYHFKGVQSGISFGLFQYLTGDFGSIGCNKLLELSFTSRLIGAVSVGMHFVVYYSPLIASIAWKHFKYRSIDLFSTISLTICIGMDTFILFDGPNVYQITSIPVIIALLNLSSELLLLTKLSRIAVALLIIVVLIQGARGLRGRWKLSKSSENPQIVSLVEKLQGKRTLPKGILKANGFQYDALNVPVKEFEIPFLYVGISEHSWTGIIRYPIDQSKQTHGYAHFLQSSPCTKIKDDYVPIFETR